MSMTGIQDPYLQLTTSDSIPGKRHNVTKYASPIEIIYGQTVLATLHRMWNPSARKEYYKYHWYSTMILYWSEC